MKNISFTSGVNEIYCRFNDDIIATLENGVPNVPANWAILAQTTINKFRHRNRDVELSILISDIYQKFQEISDLID